MRHCSKPGCNRPAVGTLTYDYGNSTAVLGPLATVAEPHTYDMCELHMTHLTVPKGWDVVRLAVNYEEVPPSDDDLMELVEAVRDAAQHTTTTVANSEEVSGGFTAFADRPHLEVIADESSVETVADGESAPLEQDTPEGPEIGPFG